MIIRKFYLDKLKLYTGKPVIKVISGMRRCGKSVLLKQYREYLMSEDIPSSNILMINKESLEFDFIRNYDDLYKYVKQIFSGIKRVKYLLIDEVQEIDQWEKTINSFFSAGDYDITITGSNARMLSTELSTLIAGRYIEIPLYPFSFIEFREFRSLNRPEESMKESFNLYIRYGGLPGIHSMPLIDEAVFPYLNAIFNTALLKDVVSRHKIREVELLERITWFIFSNCGNITSAKSISDFLKSQRTPVSVETVQNYLFFLVRAYIIHRVRRYDIQGKRELEYSEKFYPADAGLRFGLTGFTDSGISGILENLVFNKLLQNGYSVTTGQMGSLEIDFIAEKQEEKIYIQVAYLLDHEKTVEREFGNLLKIPDNFPKMVISLDEYWDKSRQGVIRTNLIEFLSGE
ncbi:MAG: ATP-binding protein [Bacteroidetes bacterium]|nr:ATP-binding protein [Bacteroidota bacterium]